MSSKRGGRGGGSRQSASRDLEYSPEPKRPTKRSSQQPSTSQEAANESDEFEMGWDCSGLALQDLFDYLVF